ncbi:MAG TPA: tripartite tricarboxylate transporter TctB family protein [Usitatibacteraceae bacterium]|nr:tripartite tricarboxylate transporter TctB family protein [Usitatibacteraceae bacterium]
MGLFFVGAGALVVNGSLEQGVGWTSTGPDSGYFPFRIGWLIIATGLVNGVLAIAAAIRARRRGLRREIFLEHGKLKPVLQVFLPMVAYVVAIRWLGLYVSSALFIAAFMAAHGKYRWRALPTGIAISAVFYVLLEVWFKVELYKGPLVAWLLERL